MTLFDPGPSKHKRAPLPVRALKGHTHLYKITYGTMQAYARAEHAGAALELWAWKHKVQPEWLIDSCVTEVTQAELDQLAETDPKFLGRLRRL